MPKNPIDYFNIAFMIIMIRDYINEVGHLITSNEDTKMLFTEKY